MALEDRINPARDGLRRVPAYAAAEGMVRIGGLVQPAVWMKHVAAAEGDPLIVDIIERPDAQAQVVVIGAAGRMVEPASRGRIVAAPQGSDTLMVEVGGLEIQATFLASYVPAINDRVLLYWQSGEATVMGKVGIIPAVGPAAVATAAEQMTTPPPPRKGTGSDTFTAKDSATYSPGFGWNTYYDSDAYQGNGSQWGASSANNGAFFYHGDPSRLARKTPVRVRFRVPSRKRAGNFNSAVTLNLFLHSSKTRPGGDVSRSSSHTIVVPANYRRGQTSADIKEGLADLPVSWGARFIEDDYGIGFSGGAYAGFAGRGDEPDAGQLIIDWRN